MPNYATNTIKQWKENGHRFALHSTYPAPGEGRKGLQHNYGLQQSTVPNLVGHMSVNFCKEESEVQLVINRGKGTNSKTFLSSSESTSIPRTKVDFHKPKNALFSPSAWFIINNLSPPIANTFLS